MKRLLLLAAFCLGCLGSYAQDDAFKAFRAGDYPTAIRRYRDKLALRPTLYDRSMLAMSYQRADSLPQAKREFEKLVNTPAKNSMDDDQRVQACDALARICQREKNYQQALFYFQLYQSIFEKARFNDVNRARFHFFTANDQAKCFAALGKADSALRVLTPYMFYPYQALNPFMFRVPGHEDKRDSLQHDTISRFYLSLLQKKYSRKQIKAEFGKAEQSFSFTEDRRTDARGFMWEELKCTIRIYDTEVLLVQRGIGNQPDKLLEELKQPYYTKAYQLDRFRELPICQMVRAL